MNVSTLFFYDWIQDIGVMEYGLKSVISPTYMAFENPAITAIYGTNFKPKIFTDITMPAK